MKRKHRSAAQSKCMDRRSTGVGRQSSKLLAPPDACPLQRPPRSVGSYGRKTGGCTIETPRKAVLEIPRIGSLDRMLKFYKTLSERGWDQVLGKLREALVDSGFDSLLAERTADKFLFLRGEQRRGLTSSPYSMTDWIKPLPADFSVSQCRSVMHFPRSWQGSLRCRWATAFVL